MIPLMTPFRHLIRSNVPSKRAFRLPSTTLTATRTVSYTHLGSKIVITGDVTQIDLPDGKASGLKEAMRVLKNVEGIGICELTNADVVRHVMVQRIVQAYEAYESAKNGGKGRR